MSGVGNTGGSATATEGSVPTVELAGGADVPFPPVVAVSSLASLSHVGKELTTPDSVHVVPEAVSRHPESDVGVPATVLARALLARFVARAMGHR
jgi:hypothetical protein